MIKRVTVALAIGVLFITGMFVFEHYMRMLMEQWAGLGIELSLSTRVMIGVAAFWGRFGVLLSPVVLAGSVGLAVLSALVWPEKAN